MLTILATFLSCWTVVSSLAIQPSLLPLSARQALANKAKELSPSQQQPPPPYMTPGWSNRCGTVLTPASLNPGVYHADRPFLWFGIDVGGRSVILELPKKDGRNDRPDLFVHSPVDIDGPMMEVLKKIGDVKYVMSPNYEHVKYASAWYQTYKKDGQITMWGCPGLTERVPDVPWTGEIPFDYRPAGWKGSSTESSPIPDTCWDTDILQPLHVNIEVNPFTGRPFFNEVIFYHKPSKSLLTTDFFWNYPKDSIANSQYGRDDTWELAPEREMPTSSRLWKFGMDKVYMPFFDKFMVTDRGEYKAIVNHILNVWDVETIIPAHGDIIRGKENVRQALAMVFPVD